MYNGIGLVTPRGSGTSGYVQANKFNLRAQPQRQLEDRDSLKGPVQKKPNLEIIEHNRKREIELKLEEERILLEDQGWSPESIERQVSKQKEELLEGAKRAAEQEKGGGETHEVALRKEGQMKKLQNAFGIGETVEGQAFNRELQEQKKLERVAEREAKDKEREKLRKDLEKQRKKADKQRQKAEKKAKKAAKAGKQVHHPEAKDDRPARTSHEQARDRDVRQGRYAARAPEPSSRRPVSNEERYNPRETSAELEERVNGPALGRCRTPSPSPPRVAQHKEPPTLAPAERSVQYARRQDLSPSPAPRKRPRVDSPEDGPPSSGLPRDEPGRDVAHEERRSRREVDARDLGSERHNGRSSHVSPRPDREQSRRDDRSRSWRESDRRRHPDHDMPSGRRGLAAEGRDADQDTRDRRRRTPSRDVREEPRRRDDRDRSPRRESRDEQRMGPPAPRQPQRVRAEQRDDLPRQPSRDRKPEKRAPSLSSDGTGGSSSSSSGSSSSSSGSSSSDSDSDSGSGRS